MSAEIPIVAPTLSIVAFAIREIDERTNASKHGGYIISQFLEFQSDPPRFIAAHTGWDIKGDLEHGARAIHHFFLPQLPLLPSPSDFMNGDCCPAERVYTLTKLSFFGTTSLGIFGAITSIISGFPTTATLSGLLSLVSVAGAFVADRAALQQALADNMENMREENATLRTNIQSLSVEVASLTSIKENLEARLSCFVILEGSYSGIAEQFRSYLDQLRTGNVENREVLARKIIEFTEQLSASRELWSQILQDSSTFQGNYTTQLNQLRNLINQLSDPRNTLLRLEEHQQINRQIQEASANLANLNTQIAQRDEQLKMRDQLLRQLKTAHQEILANYRQQNLAFGWRTSTLGAQIERISHLLGEPTSIEISMHYNVGFGNTLGIRCEPFWQETILFSLSSSEWKGRIPLRKAFKFVLIPVNGDLIWEKGPNRLLNDSTEAQREINSSHIEF